MKRTFLSKLRTNGVFYLIGSLLLLVGVPLYQARFLVSSGYTTALTSASSGHFAPYLAWISGHNAQFVAYRALLIVAFALLLTLPFTLFRVIIAQELMGEQEGAEELAALEEVGEEDLEVGEGTTNTEEEQLELDDEEEEEEDNGMPPYPWRGKGFAVLAAWAGLVGLLVYILSTIASTLYLSIVARSFTVNTSLPSNFSAILNIFSVGTDTVGLGLLALATLFFGAIIARSGFKLWPRIWVVFGYIALAVAALLSTSAVAVASASAAQAAFTSPAIFLFSLWALWLGIMLVSLKPE